MMNIENRCFQHEFSLLMTMIICEVCCLASCAMKELSIAEAAKASEAFDRVDLFKPDLVLLDTELPDGNGFDICKVYTRISNQLLCSAGQRKKQILLRVLKKEQMAVSPNRCVLVNCWL